MPVRNLEVREVVTEKERMAFIKFPWQLYRHDPNWVPPLIGDRKTMLDPKRNPSFAHMDVALFVATASGAETTNAPPAMVGTIAAIVNHRHNEFHAEKAGFFGFFECIDEPAVAQALLDTASDWVRARGMTVIRGPANLSSNDEWGMLVQGFDAPPVVMMTYNPAYYVNLVEGAGFHKAMDLNAYYFDFGENRDLNLLPSKLMRVADKVQRRGEVTVRKARMDHFDAEVQHVKTIYLAAWEKNWGFVPMTDAEMDHLAKQLKQVIDPDLVWIAELASGPDKGKVVGMGLSLPDLNQVLKRMNGRVNPITIIKALWYRRKIDWARTLLLGVIPEYRGRGVDALLMAETARAATAKGIRYGEMGWILENNEMMNRIAVMIGATVYKRYRIYEKAL